MEFEEVQEKGTNYYVQRIHELEKELEDSRRFKNLDIRVIEWLSMNINSGTENREINPSVDEIKDMLENQIAVSYLLIWPIMEQRHFSGFMQSWQIPVMAKMIAKYYEPELSSLEDIIEKFFDRYHLYNNKNNINTERLVPERTIRGSYKKILLKRNFSDLIHEEKIMLMLFVIYRYRNNIFHGSKDISSWSKYGDQISDCITGMMKITDCMKRHNIVVQRDQSIVD